MTPANNNSYSFQVHEKKHHSCASNQQDEQKITGFSLDEASIVQRDINISEHRDDGKDGKRGTDSLNGKDAIPTHYIARGGTHIAVNAASVAVLMADRWCHFFEDILQLHQGIHWQSVEAENRGALSCRRRGWRRRRCCDKVEARRRHRVVYLCCRGNGKDAGSRFGDDAIVTEVDLRAVFCYHSIFFFAVVSLLSLCVAVQRHI